MKEFNFSILSYHDILAKFAGEFHMPLKEHLVELPSNLGKGYFRSLTLPGQMEVLIIDIHVSDDFWFNRGHAD